MNSQSDEQNTSLFVFDYELVSPAKNFDLKAKRVQKMLLFVLNICELHAYLHANTRYFVFVKLHNFYAFSHAAQFCE